MFEPAGVSGAALLPAVDPERALVEAIDALAAASPGDLPEAAALERTRLVLAQLDRLSVLAVRAVADVEARKLHALDGSPTTSAWVRAQEAAGLDTRDIALARRLGSAPTVERELLAGRLSAAAAREITTALAKARPFLDRPDGLIDGQPSEPALYGVLVDGVCQLLAEQTGGAPADDPDHDRLRAELEQVVDSDLSERARVEAGLVVFAQRCLPTLLTSSLALLLDGLLPAQHDKRAARADEEAGLDLHRKLGGSGWFVHGDLDDETGEMLDVVLRAERAVDPDNPSDTDAYREAAERPDLTGLDPHHWPDAVRRPRSLRQQRHDAFKAGLRRLLDSGVLGMREKVAPHVSVITTLDFVQGVPGALPGRAASGARWSREQVRRLLCRSAFTRFVLDAGARVVEASHTQRTATALERSILHLQWGGRCAGAGCTRGPATGHPLVPHHGDLFSNTGVTSLADTVPLCKQDHHYLHDQRVLLQLKDGRWIGPDGWVQQRTA